MWTIFLPNSAARGAWWPRLGALVLVLGVSACGGGGGGGDNDPNLSVTPGTLEAPVLPAFVAGNDPLEPNQWHLNNADTPGMHLNLAGVTSYGTGVRVALLDQAVDIWHPDLAANHLFGLSWSYVRGSTDPSPVAGSDDAHGTAVAGVLAAVRNNSIGGRGVAPDTRFMVYDVIDRPTNTFLANAVARAQVNGAQVVNNSWGPDAAHYTDSTAHELWAEQVRIAARDGRQGKGLVFFMAAGNEGDSIGGRNLYGNLNEMMMVGSVDRSGVPTAFSTPGAQVLVAAPSGATMSRQQGGIVTTDIRGSAGYSLTDYTTSFQGTSASTPMASGVAALLLQNRPDLGWRDIRWILAHTASPATGVTGELSGQSGLRFHPKVGFGRLNARGAVDRAATHTLLPAARSCSGNPSTVNATIPNNTANGLVYRFNQASMGCSLQTIEYISVDLAFAHSYTGDIEVELQSPSSTRSTLTEAHLCPNNLCASLSNGWTFGSVRHLGEAAAGDWELHVRDRAPGNTGVLKSWRITLHGH
jgi:kexin